MEAFSKMKGRDTIQPATSSALAHVTLECDHNGDEESADEPG